jgi:DNA primase
MRDQRFSPAELALAESRVNLPAEVGRHIKLTKQGRAYVGLCPFHGEKTPSFYVYPDHVYCFGCGQYMGSIGFLAFMYNKSFREMVVELIGEAGSPTRFLAQMRSASDQYRPEADDADRYKASLARDIFFSAAQAEGTLVETYLKARGIRARVSSQIKFVPDLEHWDPVGEKATRWPALVAGIQTGAGSIVACQRTWLRPDGAGKAPVPHVKKTLGKLYDGAIRLNSPTHCLGLVEGLETGLSVRAIYHIPVWVACGRRMDQVAVPKSVEEVLIFGDNGEPGHKAAEKAAAFHSRKGRRVEILYPDQDYGDFNDVLLGRKLPGARSLVPSGPVVVEAAPPRSRLVAMV